MSAAEWNRVTVLELLRGKQTSLEADLAETERLFEETDCHEAMARIAVLQGQIDLLIELAEHTELEPPVEILDIARAAGATDPELYVDRGPPSGPTWVRLVVGPDDDGRRVAEALARAEKIDAPLPWVGVEEYALEVAGRAVTVRLDRRARREAAGAQSGRTVTG